MTANLNVKLALKKLEMEVAISVCTSGSNDFSNKKKCRMGLYFVHKELIGSFVV